jgi:hypothetical protein
VNLHGFVCLGRDFKNELDFDRHAEWQAGDAEDDATREHLHAEDDMRQSKNDSGLVTVLASNDLQTLSLGALVLDLEIASHRFGANVQGVAFSGLPIGQYP